jgi:hypothetical protein
LNLYLQFFVHIASSHSSGDLASWTEVDRGMRQPRPTDFYTLFFMIIQTITYIYPSMVKSSAHQFSCWAYGSWLDHHLCIKFISCRLNYEKTKKKDHVHRQMKTKWFLMVGWQMFFFGACVLTYLFLFLLFDSKRIKFEI